MAKKEGPFLRFKDKLSKFPVKEGFKNSPEKILQTTEVLTLSDHLFSKYGENYALELSDAVLKDIKLEHHAVRLRTESKAAYLASFYPESSNPLR
uniref:Pyrin domain-containing protein n=1 Tax=Varanus komodoensis TaxID=61221 RepID=A0A8D2LQB4_VARKO